MPDNTFELTFSKFYSGFSPLAHLDSLTEIGGSGSASSMIDIDILDPTYINQGPGLQTLSYADEVGFENDGYMRELINFIMEIPPSDSTTFGIGKTTIYRIAPESMIYGVSFPHLITDCTQGESMAFMSTI